MKHTLVIVGAGLAGLSAALTAHPVCPSEADANWNLQGHIRISILCLISAGNRRKFTSVFNCASLAHPCASVAGFQVKFQVPLAVVIRHLHFDEPYSDFVKHWKDCFDHNKKNTHFRTVVFRRER